MNNRTSTEEEPGLQTQGCYPSPHLYHSVKSSAAYLHKQRTKNEECDQQTPHFIIQLETMIKKVPTIKRRPIFRNKVLEMDTGNLSYTHINVIVNNDLQQPHQMLRRILKLYANSTASIQKLKEVKKLQH